MKTPPAKELERAEDGSYAGSIGGAGSLSAEERKSIRRTLAKAVAPMHLGEIASAAGIPLSNPSKHSAAATFIEQMLVSNREVEMRFEKNRRNQEVFVGWQITEHGRSLQERGLA